MSESIHEQALDLAAGNTAYRLARMLIESKQENAMLKRVEKIFDEATEFDHALTDAELNKIKAEAVREAASKCHKFKVGLGPTIWKTDLVEYANKLESQE